MVDSAERRQYGREIKMVGVSIAWWNEEGKVSKNHDYAKGVGSFEGR